jgi:hypothetical protein
MRVVPQISHERSKTKSAAFAGNPRIGVPVCNTYTSMRAFCNPELDFIGVFALLGDATHRAEDGLAFI